MDLLGGYGSDADTDVGDEAVPGYQSAGETPELVTRACDEYCTLLSVLSQQHTMSSEQCRCTCIRKMLLQVSWPVQMFADTSVGNGPLLSKLPAPKKKKRPVLLTVLAQPIPDSDSDVSTPLPTLLLHLPVSPAKCLGKYMFLLVHNLRLGPTSFFDP